MKRTTIALALLALLTTIASGAQDGLVIGTLTLVEASDEIPYAYWYYVPESALDTSVVGLVWHATPGDTMPDDPVFWARFDLGAFLACSDGNGPRVNLPEKHAMVLFSIAVTEPLPAFYEDHAGEPLGTPVTLSSLATFPNLDVGEGFLDPDLKALATIDHLKQQLAQAGIAYDPRLFITGVYSGAEWAHRFTLLHPDKIRAAAPVCGNFYTMPYEMLDDERLPWPLGLADFAGLERGAFDQEAIQQTPYHVTVSANERIWYPENTPEEQGIDATTLERFNAHFGTIPPEHGEAFADAWIAKGYPFELIWSEGGNGWIDSVRVRVFDYFSTFELDEAP